MKYVRNINDMNGFKKELKRNISSSVKSFGAGKYSVLDNETGEVKGFDDFLSEGIDLGFKLAAPCNFIG